MVSGKPSREDLVRENERLKVQLAATKASRRYANAAVICRDLFRWGFPSAAVVLSVQWIAGKTTDFNADLNAAVEVCGGLGEMLKELAPNWIVQIASAFIMVVVLWSNKRFRVANRKLANRVSRLTHQIEAPHDPNGKPSGLGPNGETNAGDVP